MLGLHWSQTATRESFAGGLVTLMGGGPGDSELISVRGLKALMSADVVVADHLAPQQVLHELDPHVEFIDVSKHPRGRATAQASINNLLIDRAGRGLHVVRLKGGDNYVFGRGFEELLACQTAGVPVRVIPGLTSAISVPALAGVPVTHRGVVHDFTVVSGHVPPGHHSSLTNWHAVAQLRGTVVLMMAVANAGAIAEVLIAGGRAAETAVSIVCDGSLPAQRAITTTLRNLGEDILRNQVHPPAVIVIGEVVAVASQA